MEYVIVIALMAASFVAGALVWRKHGEKNEAKLRDEIAKLKSIGL